MGPGPHLSTTQIGLRITAVVFATGLAIAGLLLASGVSARAHDSWISSGQHKSPAGEWCCGAGDCGVMVKGSAAAVEGGFRVDADFLIEGAPGGPEVRHITEFVPYAETQPSPDGAFWRCHRPDGARRCFFVPPPNG